MEQEEQINSGARRDSIVNADEGEGLLEQSQENNGQFQI